MWQFWDTEDILGFNIFVANNKEMKEMTDKLIRYVYKVVIIGKWRKNMAIFFHKKRK